MEFATRAIHAGQEPDPATGSTVTPLYLTSVFTYEELGKNKGYDYGRHGNPTRTALETCLASLEGGTHALCFSSGMAAVDAVFRLLRPGEHAVVAEDVYGGTIRLVDEIVRAAGIDITYVDAKNPANAAAAITSDTRLVWIETPTNPLLSIVDIAAVAEVAHRADALLGVDNTFASPYFQSPLALGADVVMHSTTKYLGGHSDLVGGALVMNDQSLYDRLYAISKVAGAVPSPFDCWLTLRGVKTLAVRMREHERTATAIARFLQEHAKVERVYYPGLKSHPGHEIAAKQMRGFGGMVAFEVKGGGSAAVSVLNGVKLFTLTGSLGGVESIISYPAQMSHVFLSQQERERRGIYDSLLRLSVGLEDADDLIADLEQALKSV